MESLCWYWVVVVVGHILHGLHPAAQGAVHLALGHVLGRGVVLGGGGGVVLALRGVLGVLGVGGHRAVVLDGGSCVLLGHAVLVRVVMVLSADLGHMLKTSIYVEQSTLS